MKGLSDMQKIKHEGYTIREGITVSVRKSKIGEETLISLGEGKIRRITDNRISIYIPLLENRIEDADKIKVFWEDGRFYFCGTASTFYQNQTQFDLLTLEGLDRIDYIEKRRHIRLTHNLSIDYKWIASPDDITDFRSKRIQTGSGENLSCGGMEFITQNRLGVDDIIEVGFEFPSFSSYMIFSQARVVRASHNQDTNMPYRVAVQFINIDPHDQRLIAEFILEELSNKDYRRDQ